MGPTAVRRYLPPALREHLKKPLGRLYPSFQAPAALRKEKRVISVGDVAALALLESGQQPWLAFVDLKFQRRPLHPKDRKLLTTWDARHVGLENPPGTLADAAVQAIRRLASKKRGRVLVVVKGEEDLLVLPLMRFAPLGTAIFYGQPREGGVVVKVNAAARKKAEKMMSQFTENKPKPKVTNRT